jgi:hypothetical protein
MEIKIVPIIRKDRVRKDGTAPIYIRVTKNRKSRFIGTGVIFSISWSHYRTLLRVSDKMLFAISKIFGSEKLLGFLLPL